MVLWDAGVIDGERATIFGSIFVSLLTLVVGIYMRSTGGAKHAMVLQEHTKSSSTIW